MGKITTVVHGFNVGIVDVDNLTRIDLERMRLAAEEQDNILGTVTGKGFLRPGTKYITTADGSALIKDFIFSADDAAVLEFTSQQMRVLVNDVVVSRPAVSTAITSGTFSASTGWTLDPSTGATTTISGGYLNLTAQGRGSFAKARQEVTVAGADQGVEHALEIVIDRGPVAFMCGNASGDDSYISRTELGEGHHSLAFTPTGNFWVEFQTDVDILRRVNSVNVAGSGDMALVTPWDSLILSTLRFDQSADVVYVAWGDEPYKIERRSNRSWSVVKYLTNDGPFKIPNTGKTRLKPNVLQGNGTLTANVPFFNAGHVGALFRLDHDGQYLTQYLSDDYQFTDAIKVTGVENDNDATSDRDWHYDVEGTWVGTVYVQRSFEDATFGFKNSNNGFGDVTVGLTANVADKKVEDSADNAIYYYRFGFKGSYTSGTAKIDIRYDGGGGYGICRVTGYTSRTQVSIEVLRPFRNTNYTDIWQEGEWSDNGAWPTAVALAEGRLFWGGEDKWWGSVSDAYESFDEELEGDSAPLSRTIAVGGVNDVQWMLSAHRLVIGSNGAEVVARSSSLDEPLTATNTTLKASSTIGSAAISPVRIDSNVVFADRSFKSLFEMAIGQNGDYQSNEITRLCSRLFSAGVKQLAIQRRPDTRIWVVLDSGECVCVVYEPSQEVAAFIRISTEGDFESVAVLPGDGEDAVYFSVKRNINGSDVRYIEKMATDTEARPATFAYVMDSYVSGTNGPASTTITGLTHLEGESVKVWADGAPINESTTDGGRTWQSPRLFTVSGGQITVPSAVTNYVVGLPYKGRYKSGRLAYGATNGTPLLAKQKVSHLGLILTDYVRSGVRYGKDYADINTMYPLRELVDGATATDVNVDTVLDEEPHVFPSGWTLDDRVCVELSWPCSLLALTYAVETNG